MTARIFLTLIIFIFAGPVMAHSGSTAFIELTTQTSGSRGEWLLALRDLEVAVGIDANQDGRITWGELQARAPALLAYARANLRAPSQSNCPIIFDNGEPVDLDGAVYWRWMFRMQCDDSSIGQLHYTAMFALDPTHRALVKWKSVKWKTADDAIHVQTLSPQQPFLSLRSDRPALSGVVALLGEGVVHILQGYDHLLFLLALLVPIVFTQTETVRKKITALLKVITAFTGGHSVTLAIATVAGWSPPTRWVEGAIAATVVVAGVNIARPLFRDASWRMAMLFGLIHGFGFASALRELDLPRSQLLLSLLNFNLGVEIGQLLVVAAVCPLLLWLARARDHLPWLRGSAAWAIVTIGGVWLAQRMAL